MNSAMPGNAGELRPVQGAVAHHEESGRHPVAPVRRDGPAQAVVVPRNGGDLGREARALVQVEVPGDAAAVFEDLRRPGVLLAGDVGGLLQEREVHVGLDVALCSRVPVPVPGAAEVAALLNDAKVVDPGLREPCAGDQAGEPAADDRDGDVVGQWGAVDRLRVGVVEVVREWPRHLDVLGVRRPAGSACRARPGTSRGARPGRSPAPASSSCRRRSPLGVPAAWAHLHRSLFCLGDAA